MQVISVIPVQKGLPFDTLTYFSNDPIPEGYLLKIPLQSREIFGVATDTRSLTEAKLDIKASAFSLKKILQIIGPSSVDKTFLRAAKIVARKSFVPLSALFGEIIAPEVFEQRQYLTREFENTNTAHKKEFVQGNSLGRADDYKKIIRDALASGKCVLFIAPTIEMVQWWKEELGRGIEKRTIVLHGNLTKTEQKKNYRNLFQIEKGVLLITTPHFAVIPWFPAIVTIIDEVSHVGYESRGRFRIDYRDLFITLVEERKTTLVIGDNVIPFRYIWKEEKNARMLFPKSYTPDHLHILDASKNKFSVLPEEIIALLKHVDKAKKRLFMYAHRKGVATLSVCRTCKTVVSCSKCSTPLLLKYVQNKNGDRERVFLCPDCGHNEPSTYLCSHCGSWDIDAKDVGIDALYDAIRELNLSIPIHCITSEQGSDEKVQEIIQSITDKSGGVIIGTDRALPFLQEMEYSVLPHFDRLLSRSSFDAGERALRLLYLLEEITIDTTIVVSKNPKQVLIAALEKKELSKYVDEEKITANALGYPPFGSIIKIHIRVPEDERHSATEQVINAVKPLVCYHVSTKRSRPGAAFVILSFIVKAGKSFFDSDSGHYEQFIENVANLPYQAQLEENPDSLW